MDAHETHLREAVAIAWANVEAGGRPYGAVVVREDTFIARSANLIGATNDPTAHAELLALREAGRVLGRPRLDDCTVYASGRPCPMCHAAMRLAGIRTAWFAFTAEEAAEHGLLSAGIYEELARPLDAQPMRVRHAPIPDATCPYPEWAARNG